MVYAWQQVVKQTWHVERTINLVELAAPSPSCFHCCRNSSLRFCRSRLRRSRSCCFACREEVSCWARTCAEWCWQQIQVARMEMSQNDAAAPTVFLLVLLWTLRMCKCFIAVSLLEYISLLNEKWMQLCWWWALRINAMERWSMALCMHVRTHEESYWSQSVMTIYRSNIFGVGAHACMYGGWQLIIYVHVLHAHFL